MPVAFVLFVCSPLCSVHASMKLEVKTMNQLREQWLGAIESRDLERLLSLYREEDRVPVAKLFSTESASFENVRFYGIEQDGRWYLRYDPANKRYEVNLSDQNFRKVLDRWAASSGWVFLPEHWSVQRDIPVGGSDAITTDFKSAVRRLLKSSLLSDLPVQPCFYSNNVMRVIPAAELCSRTEN